MRRSTRVLAASLLVAGCRAGEASAAVPGDPVRGFALVAERGCTSCHASGAVAAEPAPKLADVGARLTPRGIERALAGSARMPDCVAALPRHERPAARAALTQYLASLGGPLATAEL